MARTSIPGVIDYLVSETKARVGRDVAVVDGFPENLTYTKAIVFGGIDDDLASSDNAPAQIGRNKRREDYLVIGEIIAAVAGTSQKASRDLAFGLYNTVEDLVYGDMTLGDRVRVAQVVTVSVSSTPTDEAARGRMTRIGFTISVQHDYIPGDPQ